MSSFRQKLPPSLANQTHALNKHINRVSVKKGCRAQALRPFFSFFNHKVDESDKFLYSFTPETLLL